VRGGVPLGTSERVNCQSGLDAPSVYIYLVRPSSDPSPVAPPTPVTPTQRQLGGYFAALTLTLGLAEPMGLIGLPLLFWLKDGLHLRPQAIALFEAVALIPLYFGFVFGFISDRWRPFGRDDRGTFVIGALIAIASYCWLASNPTSLLQLLAGVFVAVFAFELLNATAEGLMTEAAQRHLMTGRLSALSEVVEIIPGVASTLIGGYIAMNFGIRASFLVAAVITIVIMAQSFWRPAAVFPHHVQDEVPEEHLQAIRRVLGNKPLWPAIGALLLWNFSPGWGTPLVFFFSDELKLSPEAFGAFRAAGFASGAVAALAYAFLCRRVELRVILWWSLILNIPTAFLVLATRNPVLIVAVSAAVGLLLGMCNIALFDLLRRSCPKRLEATGIMLGYSLFSIGGTLGDVFGSWLYERQGLAVCLGFDALATIAIIPLLLLVPREVIASRENEIAHEGDMLPPQTVLAT
jgi:MFS family permease